MKVMITHIPNTFNYGSAMMAINFIYYLNKLSNEKVKFYTDARTEEDLQNLIHWTGLRDIKVNSILPNKSSFNGKSLNLNMDWVNEYCDGIINYYDYFIVLGGDDLSEYYSKEILVNELYKINKIANKIPVILIGQTIGPFTEWRKEYASQKLKDCKIYTRDLSTYNYLKEELKLNNVISSSDLAFLNLPMQYNQNTEQLLKKYNLNIEKYVTLVPSGLVKLYTNNYVSYIDNWVEIIDYLIERYNYKIVILPHVLRPKEVDDRVVIENLLKRKEEKYKDGIVRIKDQISPLKARIILGNGRFVITGRMHAAVSSFQMGKPAISLSYSVKYNGVIGEGLNCKELIIECADNDKWRNKEVKSEVINKINYLHKNYLQLLIKIKNNSEICSEKSINMIEGIYRECVSKIYEM